MYLLLFSIRFLVFYSFTGVSPIGISVAFAPWKPTVSNTRLKTLLPSYSGNSRSPTPSRFNPFKYLLLFSYSISSFISLSGGVSDWDRTNNLQLRRLLLYPIELQRRYHKRLYQFLEFLARKNSSYGCGRVLIHS